MDSRLPIGDLGVAATLDTAGDIVRRHFRMFTALALIFIFPHQALFTIVTFQLNPDAMPYNLFARLFGGLSAPETVAAMNLDNQILVIVLSALNSLVYYGLILPLATGAVTRAAALVYLGRNVTWKECAGWSLRHFWPLTLTNLLFYLAVGAVTGIGWLITCLPLLAVLFVAGNVDSGIMLLVILLALLGGAVLVILLFVLKLRLGLFYAVAAVEDRAYVPALKRGYALSRMRVNRVLWIAAVLFLSVMFLTLGIQGIPNVYALGILTAAAGAVEVAVNAVVMTVFYFNCRALHEDLDISLLAAAGQAEIAAAAPAAEGAADA